VCSCVSQWVGGWRAMSAAAFTAPLRMPLPYGGFAVFLKWLPSPCRLAASPPPARSAHPSSAVPHCTRLCQPPCRLTSPPSFSSYGTLPPSLPGEPRQFGAVGHDTRLGTFAGTLYALCVLNRRIPRYQKGHRWILRCGGSDHSSRRSHFKLDFLEWRHADRRNGAIFPSARGL
jgi:hypothetical protein